MTPLAGLPRAASRTCVVIGGCATGGAGGDVDYSELAAGPPQSSRSLFSTIFIFSFAMIASSAYGGFKYLYYFLCFDFFC